MKHIIQNPLFFLAAVLLNTLPLWCLSVVVTQDGGSHLYNAKVLADWFSGINVGFYSHFYEINTALSPNWSVEGLLAIFLYLGIDAAYSEKILMTIYALALPFSVRYILGAWYFDKKINALWTLPLVFNFVFFYGFYNFCLSLPIAFFSLGFFQKKIYNALTINYLHYFIFTLLTLFIYFTHPVAWLVLLGAVAASVASKYLKTYALTSDFTAFLNPNFLKNLLPLLLFLPSFVLFLGFSQQNAVSFFDFKIGRLPLVAWLFGLENVAVFGKKEALVLLVLGVIFWVLMVLNSTIFESIKNGYLRVILTKKYFLLCFFAESQLFLLFAFLFFLYCFVPDATAGGAYLTVRISYFILILSFLFLNIKKPILYLIPLFFSAALWVIRLPYLENASRLAQQIVAESRFIAPKSVVLPLIFDKYGKSAGGDARLYWFKHIAARIGAEKSLILLDNYEATTNYFPLKWLPNCNSFTKMGKLNGVDAEMPDVDIAAYEKSANCGVDYVIFLPLPIQYNSIAEPKTPLSFYIATHYKAVGNSAMLFEKIK